MCRVVTAGCCLFVCFSKPLHPVGVGQEKDGSSRHHQPDMRVDVMVRHGQRRDDSRPKEQGEGICQAGLVDLNFECTAP
ncbi:hypothetical protein BDU57DRAFT_510704 [Ampelomyces quisqualis]|uniref:Histidine phosphatase superfamily n=1 Tax=Ampelomyces quisqualis TaxID=50730 RepID=A0A6A5R286_AMPQU|nr:hypothetical protein BDU57DRAFT_510704 [Ampelomyces quisqualis]